MWDLSVQKMNKKTETNADDKDDKDDKDGFKAPVTSIQTGVFILQVQDAGATTRAHRS